MVDMIASYGLWAIIFDVDVLILALLIVKATREKAD